MREVRPIRITDSTTAARITQVRAERGLPAFRLANLGGLRGRFIGYIATVPGVGDVPGI